MNHDCMSSWCGAKVLGWFHVAAGYHIVGDYAVGEHLDNNPLVNLTQLPMGALEATAKCNSGGVAVDTRTGWNDASEVWNVADSNSDRLSTVMSSEDEAKLCRKVDGNGGLPSPTRGTAPTSVSGWVEMTPLGMGFAAPERLGYWRFTQLLLVISMSL